MSLARRFLIRINVKADLRPSQFDCNRFHDSTKPRKPSNFTARCDPNPCGKPVDLPNSERGVLVRDRLPGRLAGRTGCSIGGVASIGRDPLQVPRRRWPARQGIDRWSGRESKYGGFGSFHGKLEAAVQPPCQPRPQPSSRNCPYRRRNISSASPRPVTRNRRTTDWRPGEVSTRS